MGIARHLPPQAVSNGARPSDQRILVMIAAFKTASDNDKN
jgi:hypothetical protein